MKTTKNVKIQRVTSKGQITLPIAWRNRYKTDTVLVETKGDAIEISPARYDKAKNSDYTVFDAIRDNKGKGLNAGDLIKILDKIDRS